MALSEPGPPQAKDSVTVKSDIDLVGQEEKEVNQLPSSPGEGFMQKFRLYATQTRFYIIGRNKARTHWRVLKIDRTEPTELTIREDSTIYTEQECSDLLRRVHEGNISTGGLKFITTSYGIVGFVKFLGPYYMVLVTKRKQVGEICGHIVYAIDKSELIPLSDSPVKSDVFNSESENRYKKLLCMVDLTKDFFFSYSYQLMRNLQKNMSRHESGQVLYENGFVWNEFLTRGTRDVLKNTFWTVALVHGFFKQDTLSISGRKFKLILIARRSRHYAGTRYLKRGLNEKGRVANDVETEQILLEDNIKGSPLQITSAVQYRGSIPLFWSQETSRLNLKPDIILSKRDETYQATKLHFGNLVKRYGNPIIILDLIKTTEKRPRESILRSEFANAIQHINKDLSEENRLRFLHWDLNKHSRSKANVLQLLGKVASYALSLTGFYYCQLAPNVISNGVLHFPHLKDEASSGHINGESEKPRMFQSGILRTNCIDCLDRTNVAQFAYGLAALGNQLHALGVIETARLDLDDPVADELMHLYESMGDTLAYQYGGSAAHNKIFSARRGQWKAAIQSQEFFRTIQRYYSNAYLDVERQNAINVFLGHFMPHIGNPEVWELDSDQHHTVRRNGQQPKVEEIEGVIVKRSLSDGNMLLQANQFPMPILGKEVAQSNSRGGTHRSKPPMGTSDMFNKMQDAFDSSNFVDLDWLSSCDEDVLERTVSPENILVKEVEEASTSSSGYGSSTKGKVLTKEISGEKCEVIEEFSESFVRWVDDGDLLCY